MPYQQKERFIITINKLKHGSTEMTIDCNIIPSNSPQNPLA